MKIYKVYYERLTADLGRFVGYEIKGYYTTKEKAEAIKETIKPGMVIGEAYIEEIEVEE